MPSCRNILFRADSSSNIGIGHIMRDLVLASQYKDINIIFATQNLKGNINYKIVEAGHKIEILQSNDIVELNKLIKKYQIDMVVIDHYDINYEFEKQLKIKNLSLKIMVLDDTYEKHYCDILLNHNLGADIKRYNSLVPKECELRCGIEYTLLRDEFYQKFPAKEEIKNVNILIAMGGIDSRELNIKILEVLKVFKDTNIDIITTTANKNINKLKHYITNFKNINLNIDTFEVAKLMNKSDFVILTPSVTVNEAYFMKLPFIVIKTEKNQEDIYQYLYKTGFLTMEKFDKKILYTMVKQQIENIK